MADAWEKSIIELLNSSSDFVPTEKGTMAKEITNMIMHVRYPLKQPVLSKKYCLPDQFRDQYTKTYFTKYATLETPYSRIVERGSKKVNQIEVVIGKLRKNWFTRRAVISLWAPEEDLNSKYPPCICLLQAMIRGNRLLVTALLRSNDAWLSALPDMILISSLQKRIADDLNIECGEYIHHAISYHIYDYDYSMAKEVFEHE